jgi:pterin-4a-carbinolamine dehydratase
MKAPVVEPRRFKMSNIEVVVEEKSKDKPSKLRQPHRPVGGSPIIDLKSERVQEMLAAMPGWRPVRGMRGIERFRHFPASQVAEAYAAYVKAFAEEVGQRCTVTQACENVTVTVMGRRGGGGLGITRPVIDFARRLG